MLHTDHKPLLRAIEAIKARTEDAARTMGAFTRTLQEEAGILQQSGAGGLQSHSFQATRQRPGSKNKKREKNTALSLNLKLFQSPSSLQLQCIVQHILNSVS